MKTNAHKQAGFALMMVMVLVAVGTVLGLSYLTSSAVKLAGTNNLVFATRAQYLAESGLQHALWLLRRAPEAVPDSSSAPLGPYQADGTSDGYSFWADPVAGEQGVYVITARATVGNLNREVSMRVRFTSKYADAVLAKNPQMYWRLGETAGATAHDTMGAANGIYRNGVTLGQTGAAPHSINKAAKFDGNNDHVELSGIDVGGSAATFMAWFKVEDWHTQNGRIICKAKNEGEGQQYWAVRTAKRDNEIRLQFNLRTNGDSESLTADIGRVCPSDAWIFAAGVYDGSKMRIYQDGVEVGSMNKTGDIDVRPEYGTCIGCNPDDRGKLRRFWDGWIDEVAILPVALSGEQVQALYKARLPEVDILGWDE